VISRERSKNIFLTIFFVMKQIMRAVVIEERISVENKEKNHSYFFVKKYKN
jgi:hypothetical protein